MSYTAPRRQAEGVGGAELSRSGDRRRTLEIAAASRKGLQDSIGAWFVHCMAGKGRMGSGSILDIEAEATEAAEL